jgi:hypothetical protein
LEKKVEQPDPDLVPEPEPEEHSEKTETSETITELHEEILTEPEKDEPQKRRIMTNIWTLC